MGVEEQHEETVNSFPFGRIKRRIVVPDKLRREMSKNEPMIIVHENRSPGWLLSENLFPR